MKKILGWLINETDFTLQLIPEKCKKMHNISRRFAK